MFLIINSKNEVYWVVVEYFYFLYGKICHNMIKFYEYTEGEYGQDYI